MFLESIKCTFWNITNTIKVILKYKICKNLKVKRCQPQGGCLHNYSNRTFP